MIVQRIDSNGYVRRPYATDDLEFAEALVVLAMATAIDAFTLRIDPNNDGGWTQAPTPTTSWDPRAAAPEQKQERPHA